MKCSEETKLKISKTMKERGIKPTVLPSKEQCRKNLGKYLMEKGGTPMNKGIVGKQIPWNKGIKYEAIMGDKNTNWKGGVLAGNRKIRRSSEHRNWRVLVFQRDNYTCQECGKRGCTLHSHHIKSFAEHEELRFNINNGKTLCSKCHKNIHFPAKELAIRE